MNTSTYVYITIFAHTSTQEIFAVAELLHYQDNSLSDITYKICRHLDRLPLTPELLYDELCNGFPTYPPFDSKDFGGYTYAEILDEIEVADLITIANYDTAYDDDNAQFYFNHMNEQTQQLFQDVMKIIMKKSIPHLPQKSS